MNNFNANPFSLDNFNSIANRSPFNASPTVNNNPWFGLHNPLAPHNFMHVNNPSPVNPLLGLHNFTHVSAPPAPIISTPRTMPLCDTTKHVRKLLADKDGNFEGECVSYVKVCTGEHRQTKFWGMGDQVKGNANLEKGTAIATFGPDGKYAGGHAAIYMGQDQNGIQVLDQWAERPGRPAHPVAPRTIRWDGKTPSNNGTLFHVIK